jgi:phage terminase large subunit-like protein
MGKRGPGAKSAAQIQAALEDAGPPETPWLDPKLSRAGRVIAFIESLPVTKGILAGTKFKLLDFQREWIEAIYNPATKDGRRAVRQALLSIARKNGKTGLVVGIVLAHMVGPEAEDRGEIASAANDKEQAGLIFAELVAIIDAVPWMTAITNIQHFRKQIEVTGIPPAAHGIGGKGRGTIYEALSSDAKTKHGMSPSLWIYDELAQSKKRDLFDTLQTSQGGRREPLGIVISTQSPLANHPMSELVDYSAQVSGGIIDDATFVGRVYAAPEECDLLDEKAWRAANPALGFFRDEADLRVQALKAKNVPTFEPAFRNLHLNQRVDAVEHAINSADWDACAKPVALDDLHGSPCYGGLDLASVGDITAFSLYWPEQNAAHTWLWVPEMRVPERVEKDRVPYDTWVKKRHIMATPGRARDDSSILRRLVWAHKNFDVRAIGYDRWRIEDLKKKLEDEGLSDIPMEPHGQGFRDLGPAFDAFEAELLERRLRHDGSPVMRWMASNCTLQKDDAGNRKPSKQRSSDKIDGIVTLVMAIGLAKRAQGQAAASVYEERGVFTI